MKLFKLPVELIYKILLTLKELYDMIRSARSKKDETPSNEQK